MKQAKRSEAAVAKRLVLFDPAVFVAGRDYQIFLRVGADCAVSVEIDGKRFFDHANGVIRTRTRIHRVTVPQTALDKAQKYTVVVSPLIERKPYFSRFAPEKRLDYPFHPVPQENINVYHIADAHGRSTHAIRSAAAFGKQIDLLVLNGDIVNSADRLTDIDTIYHLSQAITHGSIPVVCVRGNHDLRGRYAEQFGDYIPTVDGKTYYTLRAGGLWAIVLDTGEDKPDNHPEYGSTICCEPFRREETAFLQRVVAHADSEYNAPGVTHKLVIAHNPVTNVAEPPFDIEQDLFRQWAALLKNDVRPELFLAGHYHRCFVSEPGSAFDTLGQACPVVVGAKPEGGKAFTGCGITLKKDNLDIAFYRG